MASYAQYLPNHPNLASDVPISQSSLVRQGVLSVSASSTPDTELHYFITDVSALEAFHMDRAALNYDVFYWTPWAADMLAWNQLRPLAPIRRTIHPLAEEPASHQHLQSVSAGVGIPGPLPGPVPPGQPNMWAQQSQKPQQQNQQHQPHVNFASHPAGAQQQQFDMVAAMNQFMVMQTQLMSTLAHNIAPSKSAATPPSFPPWDGRPESKPIFLERVDVFKQHQYFAIVSDWTMKTPNTESHSTHIRSELIKNGTLPERELARFMDVPQYKVDGFAMLKDFLKHLRPRLTADRLFAFNDLVRLDMRPGESSGEYMARVRSIGVRLQGMTIDEVLPLFAMANMDQDRYPGLMDRYIQGETSVINATVYTLETDMDQEDLRRRALNLDPPSTPSPPAAQRVDAATPAPSPKSAPATSAYPPSSALDWRIIGRAIEVSTQCPACFYQNSDPNNECLKFHREVGCPAMAAKGVVSNYNSEAAAYILQQWYAKFPRHIIEGHGGRTSGRGRNEGGDQGTPPPSVQVVTTPPASAIRQQHPPSPQHQPLPPTNTTAPTPSSHYYDELESSDSIDSWSLQGEQSEDESPRKRMEDPWQRRCRSLSI